MWRNSLHVSGFFYALRKPPAGRVGAYRIRPPHTPRYMGRIRVPRVQTPFKRHSDTCAITRNMYPAFLAGVPDASGLCRGRKAGRVSQKPVPSKLRRRPASAEAGKLAGYLKSPYQANFAGVRRRPPASADAPRGESKARAGATATARAAAPRAATRAAAAAAP